MTTALEPTSEQAAAADAFTAGDHLVLQAGAGTGKTTTLALLADSTPRRGHYIAFNKAIAQAAAATFPRTVTCKTAHALAYAAIGHRYHHRLGAPRQPSWKQGQHLGIIDTCRIGERTLTPKALSSATLRTVTRFCHSADTALAAHHVPRMRGIEDPEHHSELVDLVLPYARKAWADLQHPDDGKVRFDHDHYLKIWALAEPTLPTDYLLLDEAQDTNPVLEEVFTRQRHHAQLVMVGDSAQAIYGWRGAKDVMTGFDGTPLTLSRSFRFGPALATEANYWLDLAEAPIRLTGTPTIDTTLGPAPRPDAILCRTNVGCIIEVLHRLRAGQRPALAGGTEALRSLARAAADLQAGRRTSHPELVLFETWADLKEYAEADPAGRDLAPLIDVVETHGTGAILAALDQLTDEHRAHITVSTAHKAKGREWPVVQIAADFTPTTTHQPSGEQNQPAPAVEDAEARLAYVAVTRARHHLDPAGLSWARQQ